MELKKKWKVSYYLYNLTEMINKSFYTEIGAIFYAMFIAHKYGFKTYVKEVNNEPNYNPNKRIS